MESILKSIKTKKIPINPAVVISNKSDAKGLAVAKKMGINIEVIESKNFKGTRTQYDKKIIDILVKNGVTPRNGLVCLAGFMRIISTAGLIGIFFVLIDFKMDSILLPRPEIRIPRFSN